ncbi:MAG: rhomboid family intramembrane serine protease [Lentisphaeria bacterium]|nr:rhomboid family intramembrane serine protease [Lentisphaeria bacterium]
MPVMDASGCGQGCRIEPPAPTVVAISLVLAVLFAVMLLLPSAGEFLVTWFGMNTADFLGRLRLWQPVTAIFLHAGLFHLLGNLLFLYLFGNGLAHAWRRREFLGYFLLCGVGGSLCFWICHQLRTENVVGLGASGAIFGLMGAYALIFGRRVMLVFCMIPMQARTLVAICFVIEILLLLAAPGDAVSHMAHLGGGVVGILYVRLIHRRQDRRAGRAQHRGHPGSRLRGLEVMPDGD